MSNDARNFLDSVAGYLDSSVTVPQSQDRPARLATVASGYSGSGPVPVVFDGETAAGARLYVSTVLVVAGQRVILIPVGSSFVIVGVIGGTGYRYVQTLYITSSTTFSKASYPWLRAMKVRAKGGGGGGGGASTTTSSWSVGGGGGAGSYLEKLITDIAGLASSLTVTIGAGGAGGSGSATGSTGGTTSVGTGLSVPGGDGGWGGGAYADGTVAIRRGGVTSSAPSGGDVNAVGEGGHPGIGITSGTQVAGAGGSGVDGTGGAIGVTSSDGQGGTDGGGGSGASNLGSQSTTRVGGAGGAGWVRLDLYA